MNKLMKEHVETLITKARNVFDAADAVNYSQAAFTAAQALQILSWLDEHAQNYLKATSKSVVRRKSNGWD